jgi:hypothetical protein
MQSEVASLSSSVLAIYSVENLIVIVPVEFLDQFRIILHR